MARLYKIYYISGIFLFFLIYFSFPNGRENKEIFNITTYYPSPHGVYNELRTKRMIIGERYFNITNYPQNVSLIVEGNVGIGTLNVNTISPNNNTGNLDVNDVYLRSKGAWGSRLSSFVRNITVSDEFTVRVDNTTSGRTNFTQLGNYTFCFLTNFGYKTEDEVENISFHDSGYCRVNYENNMWFLVANYTGRGISGDRFQICSARCINVSM